MIHFRLDQEATLWVARRLNIEGNDSLAPNFDKLISDVASKDQDVGKALNDFIDAVKECDKYIDSQIRQSSALPENYVELSQRRDQAKVKMEDAVNSYLKIVK